FQAEDGIPAGHVTGVQTCALPISARAAIVVGVGAAATLASTPAMSWAAARSRSTRFNQRYSRTHCRTSRTVVRRARSPAGTRTRSEERRGGDEWRSRRGVGGGETG